MDKFKSFFNRPLYQHLLYWLIVYTCYLVSNWTDFVHPSGVFMTYTIRVILQMMLAYTCLTLILPRYLATKNLPLALLSLIGVTLVGHMLHVASKELIVIPYSPEAFQYCSTTYQNMTLMEWIFNLKYALFITPATLYPPTFVLVAIQYYRKQQQVSELNEQRRTAELSALKHQLNPHFLFNTLNNLYTLALKKSDQTAVAIAKLSDILDHILYRCNEPLVDLNREVELIKSYVALEKIRYGQRVVVDINTALPYDKKIAPLLLLTFIENAFKHGVSQEIALARIDISLRTDVNSIHFRVSNTVPGFSPVADPERTSIGLQNIRRQLALLYPGRHRLDIRQTDDNYDLTLNIRTL